VTDHNETQRAMLRAMVIADSHRQRMEGEQLESQILRLFAGVCGHAQREGLTSELTRGQLQQFGAQLGLHPQQCRVVIMLAIDPAEPAAQ